MTPSALSGWPEVVQQAHHRTQVRRSLWCHEQRHVGSVAEIHLPALAAWPQWVQVGPDPDRVTLTPRGDDLSQALAVMNTQLRQQGLIAAWRDELFSLWDPSVDQVMACMERASARFWGTLTLGAHCNGYVADAQGRPAQIWVAQRALTKPTDPGKLDNLIGGGVPHGQSPRETVIREGWEEAGLRPQDMLGLQPAGILELDRDVLEGRQWERLHVFDLALAQDFVPCNQDGEVARLQCLPVSQAVDLALSGEMTVDAAWVTLDFAFRWGAWAP